MSDTPPSAPATPPKGPPADAPSIPGYRLQRRLGAGGMATVWLAVQESLEREVAIKVMSPEALTDEMARQRFVREARTIARLEHPGIVGIHEVGRTEAGHPYYVMPYLPRGALSQRDYQGDESSIFAILRTLLSALDYAHSRGIVHRDVKAENVLFDAGNRPRLTDFGIALSKADRSRITTAGLALGSGAYMAPEQARGEEVDGRADIYSLGVLAYELLTGTLPYEADDALALALMHAQDPIPRLPGTLRHWQDVIDRSLAKHPQDRFRNAAQMLRAVERLELRRESATSVRWHRLMALARLQLHRARPVLLFAGGLGLAVLATLAVWSMLPQGAPDAPAADTALAQALADPSAAAEAAPELPLPDADIDELIELGREQLAGGRLLAPGDANSADTWTQAWRVAPDREEVAIGIEQTLAALGRAVAEDIAAGRDSQAATGFARARELARDTGRSDSDAWLAFETAVDAALERRLRRAIDRFDRAAAVGSAELVQTLRPDHPGHAERLSQARTLPLPGQALAGEVPMVFVAPASGDQPALAAMSRPVTVAEYRAFASATSRASANCHLPASLMRVFARKTWHDPPFDQQADHPVVCVSFDDAQAFAGWASGRAGASLRVPASSHWQRMTRGAPAGQCHTARLACGDTRGTLGAGRFAASPLGLRDLNGNVSEWLVDCAGSGCSRRLAGGQSWRDAAGQQPSATSEFPADRGHQEVGFRLVRELRPGDNVEVRR